MFETKISSLKENNIFSAIIVVEFVNALEASEHRRYLRMKENVRKKENKEWKKIVKVLFLPITKTKTKALNKFFCYRPEVK